MNDRQTHTLLTIVDVDGDSEENVVRVFVCLGDPREPDVQTIGFPELQDLEGGEKAGKK